MKVQELAASPMSVAELDSHDRRLVLAARSLIRWQRIGILWPPAATSPDEADDAWLIAVIVEVLTAGMHAAELQDAAAVQPDARRRGAAA